MKSALSLTILLATFISLTCSAQDIVGRNAGVVVLTGGTLVDGTGAEPLANAVLVLRAGRIEQILNVEAYSPPANATVLDAQGMWMIPGLADMHVHIAGTSQAAQQIFSHLLAFGITTVQNAAAGSTTGIEAREALAAGRLVGPRMFTAGPLIDTPASNWDWAAKVETVEDVRREIQRQESEGVDLVKFYVGLEPALIAAGIDEARAHGLRTMGHLGRSSWREAAEAGIHTLVHSGRSGPTWELSDWAGMDRSNYPRTVEFFAGLDFTGSAATALAIALRDNTVFVEPNLVLTEAIFWGDDSGALARLRPEQGPLWLTEPWIDNRNPVSAQFSSEELEVLRSTFPSVLSFVRLLHENGVMLLTGTDLMNPWMTPGISLHRELELFVQAGIPPMEVLMIATRNAAAAVDLSEEFGTIEVGKSADIVVLNADPLADIRNTRDIAWIIREGEVFRPDELLGDNGF